MSSELLAGFPFARLCSTETASIPALTYFLELCYSEIQLQNKPFLSQSSLKVFIDLFVCLFIGDTRD
jgi:hypothetical protein